MTDVGENLKVATIVAPQDLTATVIGAPTDLQDEYADGLLYVLSVGAISGTPTLDVQVQQSVELARGTTVMAVGTTWTQVNKGTDDNVALAAKWTQSGARSLKTATLFLKKVGTLAAGKKLTLDIFSDDAGSPDASLATSATVDIDSLVTTTGGYVTFTFPTLVELANATVYHAVLTADYTNSSSNYVAWRSKTVGSGGNLEVKDSDWAAVTTTEALEWFNEVYAFTNLTGSVMAQVDAANVTHRLEVEAETSKRVVRPVLTVGGGSPHLFTSMLAVIASRRHPVAPQ
jgi:hypothetical protein